MKASRSQLDAFLASVERRALRMAEFTLADRDAAMDVVQDAMLRLVTRYAGKPPQQWRPLFFRILEHRLRDAQRRNQRWNRILTRADGGTHNSNADGEEMDDDWLLQSVATESATPEQQAQDAQSLSAIVRALKRLPPRQQQAFRLRIWDGLGVSDTALAMGVSPGSVKTHLSRAMATLKQELEDFAA